MTINMNLDEAVKAVDMLAGMDWSKVSAAIKSPGVIGTLTTVEDLAAFAAQFVPQAVYFGDRPRS